jgi:hypothetical protein
MTQFLQLINLSYEDYVLATRSTIRSDILFLKRAPDKLRVNNYNVHCLKAWRANTDILFVLDVYACAAYITSCVAKSSRGMSELLQTACKEAKLGQRNFKQQLRHIGNKFVFHFLLLFSFQPPFQASPSFLYTVCARARFHCDSCASCSTTGTLIHVMEFRNHTPMHEVYKGRSGRLPRR